jgi:hypothetical protein
VAHGYPMRDFAALPTLVELRKYVLTVLCRNYNLDPEQTPLLQVIITQKGKPCGLFFQVLSPRLLKNYAIWAEHEHRILYYNCTGSAWPRRV